MATIIHPCTCNHQFQDRKFGNGKRLHNTGKRVSSDNKWYYMTVNCTVCGAQKKMVRAE